MLQHSGCWEHPGHKDACNVSRCVAAGSVKQIPDAYYCCCSGSNCNDDVEIGKVPPVTYNLDPDPEEGESCGGGGRVIVMSNAIID